MKKTELQSLVQECIAEVLNEKYSEFQRVDKGSKGVAAKDKAEEDTYGAGYAAGEKAAKAKYKKLAEAYKQLKEEGFGIGKKGLEVNDGGEDRSISEALSTDAKSVVDMIEKQPMILQKLKLINTREELESVLDYLVAKINPQLTSNATGVRTAATNVARKLNEANINAKELGEFLAPIAKQHGFILSPNAAKGSEIENIVKSAKGNIPGEGSIVLDDFSNPEFLSIVGKDKNKIADLRKDINSQNKYNLVGTGEKEIDGLILSTNRIQPKITEARFEKGEDIGEPGKGFAKIAKSAAKRYGSKEVGQKVAGAILKKVLAKEANKDVYAGFGDTWYDTNNKPYTGGFDFEYDEETFDNLDNFVTKYKDKQKFFTPGDLSTRIFDKYKQKYGPLKIRIKK